MASDYVSFRDDNSRALAYDIGFRGEARVCPDSVYGLEVATANKSPVKGHGRPIVGFAPMPYPDRNERGYLAERDRILYDEFIRKFGIFASLLVGQSYALRVFGTDIGVDPLAIEDFQTALLSHHCIPSSHYSVNQSVNSVGDLLEAMSGTDYVVTCRFHGVVFAHLLNKPVLALAHHPKVMDLMHDLELSRYCVDIRHFDPEVLMEKFALMVSNAEEIRSRMATSLATNRRRLRSQFDELFGFERSK
jgi:polysaccharide pyruvyl transferase WcaK-like protein